MRLSDEKKYWIAFSHISGFGAVRFHKLIDHFGSLANAWNANLSELSATGISKKIIENFILTKKNFDIEKTITKIESQGIDIYFSDEENYPLRLSEIEQKPPVLYVLGEILPADQKAIGVVGARKMTSYGKQVTTEIAQVCAENGVTTISGLARGIDAVCHMETLRFGGRTVAVLGSGVDVIYPPEHRGLAIKISQNGAVISEFAPGAKPDRFNFPIRNRIISGLSEAIVVVEGSERSGSLLTAEYALNQGREVFAVPGPITSPNSAGTNQLIKDGALILLSPKDLLNFFNINSDKMSQIRIEHLEPTEILILRNLGVEPTQTDDLFNACGLTMEKFMAVLTMLELKGIIDQSNGIVTLLRRMDNEG